MAQEQYQLTEKAAGIYEQHTEFQTSGRFEIPQISHLVQAYKSEI